MILLTEMEDSICLCSLCWYLITYLINNWCTLSTENFLAVLNVFHCIASFIPAVLYQGILVISNVLPFQAMLRRTSVHLTFVVSKSISVNRCPALWVLELSNEGLLFCHLLYEMSRPFTHSEIFFSAILPSRSTFLYFHASQNIFKASPRWYQVFEGNDAKALKGSESRT